MQRLPSRKTPGERGRPPPDALFLSLSVSFSSTSLRFSIATTRSVPTSLDLSGFWETCSNVSVQIPTSALVSTLTFREPRVRINFGAFLF